MSALCVLVVSALPAQPLTVETSAGSIVLTIKNGTEHDYLLTRANPVQFSVTGPCRLRVYSRLAWRTDMKSPQQYELVLNSLLVDSCSLLEPRTTSYDAPGGGAASPRAMGHERHETLTTEKSASARGPGDETYAKWRSFYFRVAQGRNSYRLLLGNSTTDRVAVRFSFEPPAPWTPLVPSGAIKTLKIKNDTTGSDWFRLDSEHPLQITLMGSARLLSQSRLDFVRGTPGPQKYELRLYEGDVLLARETLIVRRSKNDRYLGESGMIPSPARRLRLDLPVGEHNLTVRFQATQAPSAVLRLWFRPRKPS
jgi:hypothetical protein